MRNQVDRQLAPWVMSPTPKTPSLPDAMHPEEGESGEQARAVEVQASHCLLYPVAIRHYMQAAVICHVALHAHRSPVRDLNERG